MYKLLRYVGLIFVLLFWSSSLLLANATQKQTSDSLMFSCISIIDAGNLDALDIAQSLFLKDSNNTENVYLFSKSNILFGDKEYGISLAQKLIQRDSTNFSANVLLANYARDPKALDILLSFYSDEAVTDYLVGKNFLANSNIDSALFYTQKSISKNPSLEIANLQLATLYFLNADFKSASKHFSKCLSLIENDATSLNQYGVSLLETNRFLESNEILGRSVELDSTDPSILYNYGLSLMKSENFSTAREAFARALSNGLQDTSVYILMAKCCEREQDFSAAQNYYKTYKEKGGKDSVWKNLWLLKATVFLSKFWHYIAIIILMLGVLVILVLLKRKS
jgi:Tfp pilus assembly protein PilF